LLQVGQAHAAILGGDGLVHQPQLVRRGDEILGELRCLVVVGSLGADDLSSVLACGVLERALRIRELKIHAFLGKLGKPVTAL